MTSAQTPFPFCTGCAILKPRLTFGCDLASGSCGGNMVPGKCCVFIPATVTSLGSISVATSCGCPLRALAFFLLCCLQDGGSLDQVLKEAKRIPEEILGKVSIAVSVPAPLPLAITSLSTCMHS